MQKEKEDTTADTIFFALCVYVEVELDCNMILILSDLLLSKCKLRAIIL